MILTHLLKSLDLRTSAPAISPNVNCTASPRKVRQRCTANGSNTFHKLYSHGPPINPNMLTCVGLFRISPALP